MSKLITLSKLKTALTPLIALINKKAERPNWNENDTESVSYIENRPFYTDEQEVAFISGTYTTINTGNGYTIEFVPKKALVKDNVYQVSFNGESYSCVCWVPFDGISAIGNGSLFGLENSTEDPFLIMTVSNGSNAILVTSSEGIFNVSVIGIQEKIVKIPEKYLPELNYSNIGAPGDGYNAEIFNDYENNVAGDSYSHAEGQHTNATGYASHAEGINTEAAGDCSHAEGHITHATGENSHAEGYNTRASGYCSHAEGTNTLAAGYCSHAEGESHKATGRASHAEGISTQAIGDYSHAEGRASIAIGDNAHAEGQSTAIEDNSHAEGSTYSMGSGSHSEGSAIDGTIYIDSIPSFSNDYLTTCHTIRQGMVIYKKPFNSGSKTADGIYAKITNVIDESGQKRITTNVPLFYNFSDGTTETEMSRQTVTLVSYGIATSSGAHSEGASVASGSYSHSEGYKTLAMGSYSHSEGENTVAASAHQHVQGRYNVEDSNTTYLHIVGNGHHSGTMGTTYSNAHTLDWDGNAWFSGDVYVDSKYGRNRDEGSKKLATEEYVNNAAATAITLTRIDEICGVTA